MSEPVFPFPFGMKGDVALKTISDDTPKPLSIDQVSFGSLDLDYENDLMNPSRHNYKELLYFEQLRATRRRMSTCRNGDAISRNKATENISSLQSDLSAVTISWHELVRRIAHSGNNDTLQQDNHVCVDEGVCTVCGLGDAFTQPLLDLEPYVLSVNKANDSETSLIDTLLRPKGGKSAKKDLTKRVRNESTIVAPVSLAATQSKQFMATLQRSPTHTLPSQNSTADSTESLCGSVDVLLSNYTKSLSVTDGKYRYEFEIPLPLPSLAYAHTQRDILDDSFDVMKKPNKTSNTHSRRRHGRTQKPNQALPVGTARDGDDVLLLNKLRLPGRTSTDSVNINQKTLHKSLRQTLVQAQQHEDSWRFCLQHEVEQLTGVLNALEKHNEANNTLIHSNSLSEDTPYIHIFNEFEDDYNFGPWIKTPKTKFKHHGRRKSIFQSGNSGGAFGAHIANTRQSLQNNNESPKSSILPPINKSTHTSPAKTDTQKTTTAILREQFSQKMERLQRRALNSDLAEELLKMTKSMTMGEIIRRAAFHVKQQQKLLTNQRDQFQKKHGHQEEEMAIDDVMRFVKSPRRRKSQTLWDWPENR